MPKAVWNGAVIAEADETVEVEGTQYFPPESVNEQYLKPSTKTTECGWKGTAHYYTIDVGGQLNADAAWYYSDPKPEAANIKGYIAFWKGVDVLK